LLRRQDVDGGARALYAGGPRAQAAGERKKKGSDGKRKKKGSDVGQAASGAIFQRAITDRILQHSTAFQD